MKLCSTLFLAILLCCTSLALAQQPNLLSLSQTISLPDVQSGFNHMSVDAAHHRLFASAPTNKTLEIIDLSNGKPLRSLQGEKPAAALYAPEFNQLYVSRGQTLVIYDGATFNPITTIDVHSNLDELQYDAQSKELYVGCMSPENPGIAVISIPAGKLLATIPLPAKPQGFAVERNGTRIFSNVPNQKQIAVIDRRKRVVLQPWPLSNFEGNSPIAFDEAHHRLFVGARRPAQLVVIDTDTGMTVATVDINSDTDDLSYDPATRRIYLSCGEGFIDVIQQRDADHYQSLTRIPTTAGARTSTFSPALSAFFLGVPRRADQPAEIRVFKSNK